MDGRRHSVDIPISKTLVALRRVRSLRDPSTNSMTKLAGLVDNFNWDTNSCNAISLRFEGEGGCIIPSKPQISACREQEEEEEEEMEMEMEEEDDNGLELACMEPFNHEFDPNVEANKYRIRNDDGHDGIFSPYAHSSKLMLDSDNDIDRRSYGISCCWSGTPTLSRLSFASDDDAFPLLSRGNNPHTPTEISGHTSCNELVVHSERSLSQKYKPKSFSELVGQTLVSRSLLGAIAKGRVASLYLFHGPRGTGKSCTAAIFAAALNCLSLEQHRPCGLCQECLLYFAGRSRDVKEVDSARINRTSRIRSLIKNATVPSVSSRFRVFIFDECQFLGPETWAALLNGLSRHTVFVMVTSELEKVPRSAVARSQRYHFPKIKEVDISNKMRKVCVQEGLEFEEVALDFIAAKSNGSLRDAEMMLDQLSLLTKHITMSLASDLVGTVCDDELLNLLDLALSADTSNTVKRARELMRSRIDPMQLISQLANIIMDILAGNIQEESSEVKKSFLQKHSCEPDLQKLRHALKILSESEKQLRASKNQTTWLTVALLHLNSVESPLSDPYESRLSFKVTSSKDGDCCSTSSPGERSKHIITCDCQCDQSALGELQGRTLEVIWMKATEKCESNSLKSFLRKRAKLVAVYVKKEGMAVAELEFGHPDYASKAEKSWKAIASALQSVIGRNVELRMKSSSQVDETRRPSFSFNFFNCSRRTRSGRSKSMSASGGDEGCENGQLRNSDGNTLSNAATACTTPSRHKPPQHNMLSSSSSPIHGEASFDAYICSEYPYVVCNASNHDQRSRVHCWRTPQLVPTKKGRQQRNPRQKSHLVDWVLPCAAAAK